MHIIKVQNYHMYEIYQNVFRQGSHPVDTNKMLFKMAVSSTDIKKQFRESNFEFGFLMLSYKYF